MFEQENIFYVYVVRSLENGRYYVGHTNNLVRRIGEHNEGFTRSLRKQGPFELVYKETLADRTSAIKRERKIKSYKGGDAFKKLIAGPIV